MGLRFHKALSIISGLRLNFSKSGPSLSVGGKGLTYNIGTKGTRTTVGLPGSGLSYSTSEGYGGQKRSSSSTQRVLIMILMIALAYGLKWAQAQGYF